MANEVQVSCGLTVRKGSLNYVSNPQSFRGTLAVAKGPTPGAIAVPTSGVDVDLSELTTPGYARVMNLDPTNYVEYGVHDGADFHPVGEILPGESYPIRFSRNLGEIHEAGTGTGTTGTVNAFHMRANGAACVCIVEAFEA